MKKLSLLSLALLGVLFLSNCKKETEDGGATNNTETPKQRAVGIYFGGTWCPPCGAYGKPAKEQLVNQLGDDVILISCQVNGSTADPMNNADANSFAAGFGVTSVPILYTGGGNGVMQGAGGSSVMATTVISNANAILTLAPSANISATYSISGSSVTVNTTTKFLQDQTEEYMVGAYLLEDGITATQSSDGSTNKNIHDHILRTKLSTAIFGDAIGSNLKKGDSKEKSFTGTINPSWNSSKLSVAVVLWRKNTDGKVTISNGVNATLK
jgi:thiol-disulfide isomerase/thioredoxin